MKTCTKSPPQGFTLIELLVVIVIIAVLAGLLFPVFGKSRRIATETRTVSNLRQIGAAMGAYCAEKNGDLPGPLSLPQYGSFGLDPTRDKGSLAKLLAPYLSLAKKTSESSKTGSEADLFACPGVDGFTKDDVPGYIMNLELVTDYNQAAWGDVTKDELPLKKAALSAWRLSDADAAAKDAVGTEVILARKWAMRHTDQKDLKEVPVVGLNDGDEWVKKLPEEPAFDDHYQALYFDWHVERYVSVKGTTTPGPIAP